MFKEGGINMREKLSFAFATIASICFVSGMMILSHPIRKITEL